MASLLQTLAGFVTKALPTAETVGQILLDVEIDTAQLEAGQQVPIPRVQIASVGGKAVYLEGVLSTT